MPETIYLVLEYRIRMVFLIENTILQKTRDTGLDGRMHERQFTGPLYKVK